MKNKSYPTVHARGNSLSHWRIKCTPSLSCSTKTVEAQNDQVARVTLVSIVPAAEILGYGQYETFIFVCWFPLSLSFSMLWCWEAPKKLVTWPAVYPECSTPVHQWWLELQHHGFPRSTSCARLVRHCHYWNILEDDVHAVAQTSYLEGDEMYWRR